MGLHTPPECKSAPLTAGSFFASPDAGPHSAYSCLRRPQVLGGPCFALHPLWPPSRMHARVPLISGDGSHDPARFLDRDRTLRASQSSLPWTM